MTVYIGGARHDERGRYEDGQAGDQTGTEVNVSAWWSYPWSAVYRCKDATTRAKLRDAMLSACQNNNIGYDMNDRNSLKRVWLASGKNIDNVKTKCECDCSSLVSLCVTQSGVDILTGTTNAPVTATLGDVLLKTGKFEKLAGAILTNPNLLVEGDILVKPYGHTEIVIGTSTERRPIKEEQAKNDEGIKYRAHVQSLGDLPEVRDGLTAGTTGKALRLECIDITCPEKYPDMVVSAKYHLQGKGWRRCDAARSISVGTKGQSRRLEAFELNFENVPEGKTVKYSAHIEKLGWCDAVENGYTVGSMGQSLRIEAVRIWIE